MIFFFYGENTYASKAKIRELTERFIASTGSNAGLERFDQDTDPSSLQTAMTSLPFLVDSRLVIMRNPSLSKQLAETLIANLENVPEKTVIVIHEDNADKRTSFFKTLVKDTKATEFKNLNPNQLVGWLQKLAQTHNADLSSSAAQALAEQVGSDQWRLEQELLKLINTGQSITKELIVNLVESAPEQTIFDMIDALSRGESDKALKHYYGLRSQKAEPLYVLTMIGWQLRNLLVVKAAGDRSAQIIAKEAGISPFVVNKSLQTTRKLGLENIRHAYEAVIDTDYQIKTTGHDADGLVEQLILVIARDLYV